MYYIMFGQSTQNLEKNINSGNTDFMVGYSPKDLFFNSTNIQQNTEICANYEYNNLFQDNACNVSPSIDPLTGIDDGGYSCFNRELCKNMAYSEILDGMNSSHEKSNKGFKDTNTQYNLETINMVNLITGIAVTFLIMYYV